jgi:hypothetical protein
MGKRRAWVVHRVYRKASTFVVEKCNALLVIPAKAGIQFKYASEGHFIGFECFARRIETGFRLSPE